jgi:hypothetical protein
MGRCCYVGCSAWYGGRMWLRTGASGRPPLNFRVPKKAGNWIAERPLTSEEQISIVLSVPCSLLGIFSDIHQNGRFYTQTTEQVSSAVTPLTSSQEVAGFNLSRGTLTEIFPGFSQSLHSFDVVICVTASLSKPQINVGFGALTPVVM